MSVMNWVQLGLSAVTIFLIPFFRYVFNKESAAAEARFNVYSSASEARFKQYSEATEAAVKNIDSHIVANSREVDNRLTQILSRLDKTDSELTDIRKQQHADQLRAEQDKLAMEQRLGQLIPRAEVAELLSEIKAALADQHKYLDSLQRELDRSGSN